jgi:murein L,D-transpeptidase YcbB/YkuD
LKKSDKTVSRRQFVNGLGLGAAGLGVAGLSGGAAFAQVRGNPFRAQAEWTQKYDADARLRVRRTETPLLSAQTIAGTEQAIAQYQQLAARGGWGTVPSGRTLKLGARSRAVQALRQRLAASGDLGSQATGSPIFDSYVEAGVRRFQARHGISSTGVVSRQTFRELNVPIETRLRQLELNLVRLRSYAGNLGDRHVILNIPAATVQTVENGRIATHHIAGVGKIDRQSPIMQARALAVNFNPFWTVPASIIRKDLIPKMQKDPNYLTENKIRIFTRQGTELQPSQVNWNSMEATNYRFRQDPGGELNSLGFVRIDIANKHGVYMHDTPTKGIFGDDYRFVSSGCVRVQNVRDYVAWLLRAQGGWDRDRIDEAIRSGRQETVRLTPAVPVYWVYITAWASDGIVQFRDDVYKRDGAGGTVAQNFGPKVPVPGAVPADYDQGPGRGIAPPARIGTYR